MTGPLRFLPPQLRKNYMENDLQGAYRAAQNLLRRRKLTKLTFNPSGEQPFEQAKRFCVMGLAVKNKFDHLFTDKGIKASERAYDRHHKYVEVLKQFPDPLKQFEDHEFEIVEINPLELLEIKSHVRFPAIRNTHPIVTGDRATEAFVVASAHAIVNAMYEWCIGMAGNRPRNFQMMYRSEQATLGAKIIKGLVERDRFHLDYYAEFFHPTSYFVVDALLINSKTELPFNINIPF